jgi:hypothetical protein
VVSSPGSLVCGWCYFPFLEIPWESHLTLILLRWLASTNQFSLLNHFSNNCGSFPQEISHINGTPNMIRWKSCRNIILQVSCRFQSQKKVTISIYE